MSNAKIYLGFEELFSVKFQLADNGFAICTILNLN